MPELPEVETIRRDLIKFLKQQEISAVNLITKKTVKNKAAFFISALVGSKIINIFRQGKLLIFQFKKRAEEKYLLIHLKMTGQLIFKNQKQEIAGGHSLSEDSFSAAVGGDLPNKYTRVYFVFKSGDKLFFNDLRRFGYLQIVDFKKLEKIKQKYGPEPLSKQFSFSYLKEGLKGRRSNIKAFLLKQNNIAGLGNIYVDEALFLAGINPKRKANNLTKQEISNLLVAINKIINQAIESRGTTFNNFVDLKGKKGNFVKKLQVYGRFNQNCYRCQKTIKKIKLAGRGTHYCSYCQK